MKKTTVFFLMALTPALALSQTGPNQPSYTWLEGGYARLNIDTGPGSHNEDGWAVRGSAQFTDMLYGFGGFERWTPTGFDVEIFQLGLGYRMPINPGVDFNAELGWIRTDLDQFGSQNGARGTIGLRGRPVPIFEYNAYIGGAIDGPENNGLIVGANGIFHFTEVVGLSLRAETYDFDVNVFSASLRLSF